MVERPTSLATVRLVFAGGASLALLAWIGFMPGGLASYHARAFPPTALVAAAVSLLILVCLTPVLWRGTRRDRWLAASLLIFPLLVLGLVGLELLAVKF